MDNFKLLKYSLQTKFEYYNNKGNYRRQSQIYMKKQQ